MAQSEDREVFDDLRSYASGLVDAAPPLDPDPEKQVFVCMEITPYIRSNDYRNKKR